MSLVIEHEGQLVGSVVFEPGAGLERFSVEVSRCDGWSLRLSSALQVGYWLDSTVWNRGIMSEALRLALGWIWKAFPTLHRIEAPIFEQNGGSIKCASRAGLVQEGISRAKYFKDEEFHNCVVMATVRQ